MSLRNHSRKREKNAHISFYMYDGYSKLVNILAFWFQVILLEYMDGPLMSDTSNPYKQLKIEQTFFNVEHALHINFGYLPDYQTTWCSIEQMSSFTWNQCSL